MWTQHHTRVGAFAAHWSHVASTPDTELLWGATWLAGLFKASRVTPLCSKAGTGPMKGVVGEWCLGPGPGG